MKHRICTNLCDYSLWSIKHVLYTMC